MAKLTGVKKAPAIIAPAEVVGVVAGARKAQEDKLKKPTPWQKWTAQDIIGKMEYKADMVPGESKEEKDALVLKLIDVHLSGAKKDAKLAKNTEPAHFIIELFEDMINDEQVDWRLYMEPADEGNTSEGDEEQPIIEVSQSRVKAALKILLTTKSQVLTVLYESFDEFNQHFFHGDLPTPVITIDTMNNRTLGCYYHGQDAMGVTNHISFNRNFIALNKAGRILETLRHEMIHMWQDEVLYVKDGEEPKEIKLATLDEQEEGKIVWVDGLQKFRPKEWHNRDFKAMAIICGIPADGSKCTGNAAEMPQAKSYNRKFICSCMASNNYPQTIWSTREIKATCHVCKKPFIEVSKTMTKGKTIEVKMSHVELPGQDAVHDAMKSKYTVFERFETKSKKDAFVETLKFGEAQVTELEQGAYQKNHNSYSMGYRYWVAYSPSEAKPEKPEAKVKASEDQPQAADKKRGKIVKFPGGEPDETKAPERAYSIDSPQDILDLYKELGGVRKLAEHFGVKQSVITDAAKKMGIDWGAGTFIPE